VVARCERITETSIKRSRIKTGDRKSNGESSGRGKKRVGTMKAERY
jgi:hypothetical protein